MVNLYQILCIIIIPVNGLNTPTKREIMSQWMFKKKQKQK